MHYIDYKMRGIHFFVFSGFGLSLLMIRLVLGLFTKTWQPCKQRSLLLEMSPWNCACH